MGVGRFFCVALPFALTVGSIIFLLVGTLAGVADKSLYLFQADLEHLSVSPVDVGKFIEKETGVDLDLKIRADANELETNITAKHLNLEKKYLVSLWNYCYIDQKDKRHCVEPKFNWAAKTVNNSRLDNFVSLDGQKIELPKELKKAIKYFQTAARWTEIAFIAALLALACEIVFGIFASCTRVMSCITWIFATIATLLVCIAAGASTAMAVIVVGAIKTTAKLYGVKGKINNKFLATVWIAAAFAIASGLFWIFTICCCKPERRSRESKRHSDGEKLLAGSSKGTGSYAPLSNDHEMTGYYNQNQAQSQSQYGAPRYPAGAARSDLAYEPYSHRA